MFAGTRDFYRRIVDNFGWEFAVVLISVYGILKGLVAQVSGSAVLPYFKSINVSADKYQSYLIVSSIPWSMKAAMGILSDAVPIMGYHKISYILIASILGTIAYAILGVVQFTHETAPISSLLMLVTQFQLAFVDLLTEGKYAELMVQNPQSGSDLVSFAWGLYNIGTFIGSTIGGPMADNFNPRYIFLVCLPLAAQIIYPTITGWFPDVRLPADRRGIRHDKLQQHPDLVKLSIAMTLCSVLVATAALFASGESQSLISMGTALALCVLGNRWLPSTIRRANLYMFLASLFYVSISGATDYWFTANEKCVPGGPKFSFTFYNTYASLVASVAGGFGVVLFQRYFSRGSFRTAFGLTCFIKILGSIPDIAIFTRFNIKMGIPDKVAFMLGDAVIQQVAVMLDFMPAVVLTSKVCPRGMEASVFALLASYQNMGSTAARAIGVGLTDFLGIKSTVPCNFDNLPLAVIISHMLLPSLTLPFIFLLIPDVNMTDDLITSEDDDGQDGESVRVPGSSGDDGDNVETGYEISRKSSSDSTIREITASPESPLVEMDKDMPKS